MHQFGLVQNDRCLHGELLEQRAFSIVEWRDIRAPHGQHADDVVVKDHRGREQGAKSGQPLQIQATVVRIIEDVADLVGALVLGRTTDRGQPVPRNRVLQQVSAVFLGRLAGHPRDPEHIAVQQEQLGSGRSAQARGVLEDRLHDGSGVYDVAAERRQDLAARRQLLSRVLQFAIACDRRGHGCAMAWCAHGRLTRT